MSGFTPGPWHINLDPQTSHVDGEKLSIQSEDMYIAQVDECMAQRANANLIAAAPRILEALEKLVRINEEHNESIAAIVGRPVNWKDEYLNEARAAIANAKGESE